MLTETNEETCLECVVINIIVQRMFIAPLPIWSYVGLGMGSNNVVMHVHKWNFGAPTP